MGRHPVVMLYTTLLGLALAAAVHADERVSVERGLTKIDLDAGSEVPGEPSLQASEPEVLAAGDNCEPIGSFQDDFTGTSRYRGNVYSIVGADAVVEEIEMQLRFFGTTNLSFSIHERVGLTTQYVRKFEYTLLNAEGIGASIFYSTGGAVLGTTLKKGRDYAIGVTWGPGAPVVYGRNNQAQPTTFAGGKVLGLTNRNSVTPPLDEEVALSITNSGAYSMRICLQPAPGACCQDFGGSLECREILEADCTVDGGFFHGQRTSCSDIPCRFGACCAPCDGPEGLCRDDYTPQTCNAIDGTHQPGLQCDDFGAQCEPVTGACCFGIEGRCEPLCEADCIEQLGTYRGDDTTCDPIFDPCRGACCVPEFGCINRSQQACLSFNQGQYRGNGTTCATLSPVQRCDGACCFKQGQESQCVDGDPELSRAACSIEQDVDEAIYIGDTFSCPATCPELNDAAISACCLPSGACINTNEHECQKLAGVWNNGGDCGEVPVCKIGACCMIDGTCRSLTEEACVGFDVTIGQETVRVGYGGYYGGDGSACSAAICDNSSIPKGACCDAFGQCTKRRRAVCNALGGRYAGDSMVENPCAVTTCTPFGACCRSNGTCSLQKTSSQCGPNGLNGTYLGNGSSCADATDQPICDLRGACCTDGGTCLQLLPDDCFALKGSPTFFAGGDCTEMSCGACCDVEGDCQEVIEEKCPSEIADFTEDVGCRDLADGCEPHVVCCTGEFLCEELTEKDCLLRDGIPQGLVEIGVYECSSALLCQVGSCCFAGACADTDAFRFKASCESFASDAAFVPGERCDLDDPCAPVGGCCVDGACQDNVASPDCAGQGGTFLGKNVSCGGASCGGCCNGMACRDSIPSRCTGPGDTFFAGTTCDEDQPCAPSGACCVGGVCQASRTQAQCSASGGIYLGNNTSCAGGACLLGACCHRDGTCDNGQVAVQCTAEGDVFSRGFQCAQVSCLPEPTACCHLVDNVGRCDVIRPDLCLLEGGFPIDVDTCDVPGLRCDLGSCCTLGGACTNNVFQAACQAPSDFSTLPCNNVERGCTIRGACCVPDVSTCQQVSQTQCANLGGFYAGNQVACTDDFCALGACCIGGGDCIADTLQACQLFGNYAGAGTNCATAPCCQFFPLISDPANCTIDGGMPGDGGGPVARPPWSIVTLTYDCALQQVPSYTVSVVPAGVAPTVEQVDIDGVRAIVTLSDPIEPGKWTCLHQFGTDLEWCFGSLPADVNGNRTADTNDLTRLLDQLNGQAMPVATRLCDADRTNKCLAPDMIKLIDLLNGGWNGKSLPVCPTAP